MSIIKKGFLAYLAVLMISLTGAASGEECSSKIDEAGKKFSVVLRYVSGMESQSFNDIGCAVVSRNGECATRQGIFDGGAAAYDYPSGEEVPVEKAYFVLKTDVKTPAGYGIIAFRDKAEAEKFSAGHGKGKVVKWWELVDEKLK